MLVVLLVGIQKGPTVYSAFETYMFSSSRFVVGTVAKVDSTVLVPPGGTEGGVVWQHGKTRMKIRVNVGETFIGPSHKSLEIVQDFYFPISENGRKAFASGVRSFWTRDRGNGEWHWFPLDLPPSAPKGSGMSGNFLPVFSMDFTILRTGDQAIKAARQFGADLKADPHAQVIRIGLPASLAMEVQPFADGIIFETLLNPRSKKIAQNLINNPFHFLLPESRYQHPDGRQSDAEQLRSIGRHLLEQSKHW